MTHVTHAHSRSRLGVATGILFTGLALAIATTPARAQAANAADLCTPDVMRLCSEHIPDADRIVGCLKAKSRQLSPQCRAALAPPRKANGNREQVRQARDH